MTGELAASGATLLGLWADRAGLPHGSHGDHEGRGGRWVSRYGPLRVTGRTFSLSCRGAPPTRHPASNAPSTVFMATSLSAPRISQPCLGSIFRFLEHG